MSNILVKEFRIFLSVLCLLLCAGSLRAQSQCSNTNLVGAYGFAVRGTNAAANLQFAITGRFVADGNGHFEGSGTQTVSGNLFKTSFQGGYHINSDCTGSATLTFTNGPSSNLDFVLVNDGKEVLLIVSDPGTVETGTAKKQFVQQSQQAAGAEELKPDYV